MKVCAVTGAAAGIGHATAIGLAKAGTHVVAVVRDAVRGEATVQAIRAASGSAEVSLLVCDLSSQQSIRDAAAELGRRHSQLDVLVNQAGVYAATRKVTVDGLELMFAVNQLAYQAFTVPLIPLLKAAGHARVVNGTGALEAAGEIDFDDLQSEKSYKPFKALTQSKLGNLLFTRELARRLDGTGVTVTAFHPGGVKTTFGAGEGGVLGWVMGFARMFVPIALALDGAYASVTGQYFLELKPGEPSAKARDPERARRLWEIGERLSGARFPEASG